MSMIRENVVVKNATGLHARPASEFVKIASSYPCEIDIDVEGEIVCAKSIIGILSMGISQGTEVGIICDGENENEALKSLVDFIDSEEIE